METQNLYSSMPNNDDDLSDEMDSSPMKSRIPRLLIGRKVSDGSVGVDSMSSTDDSECDDTADDLGNIEEIQDVIVRLRKEKEQLLMIRGELEKDRRSWQSGHATMSSTPLQGTTGKDKHLSSDDRTSSDSNPAVRTSAETAIPHSESYNEHAIKPITDTPPGGVRVIPPAGGAPSTQRLQQSPLANLGQRATHFSSLSPRMDPPSSFHSPPRSTQDPSANPQLHIPMQRLPSLPSAPQSTARGQVSPREFEGQQSRFSPRQLQQPTAQMQPVSVRRYDRSPVAQEGSPRLSSAVSPRVAVQEPVLSLEDRMQQLMVGRPDLFPGTVTPPGLQVGGPGPEREGFRGVPVDVHSAHYGQGGGSALQSESGGRFHPQAMAMGSPRLGGWPESVPPGAGGAGQLHAQGHAQLHAQGAFQRPLAADGLLRSMVLTGRGGQGLGGGLSPRSLSSSQSSYEWEIDPRKLTFFDKVGSGSFGEVTRASWMGIQVAVKRIRVRDPVDPAILRDFRSELDILSKVRHTNCILFMGACSYPPELMIVTEYAKRGSLFELLHNKTEMLDWRLRLRIAFEAATGVLYLHTRPLPIVHRDLKSENILLTENCTVKICDFGMARLKLHSTHIETQHANAGTPAWMAPEVLRGEHFDEKADVYSFSVVLWEILYRKEPWADQKPLQILSLVGLMGKRLELPQTDLQCPPAFVSLIRECWAHQPASRPDFAQIVHRLQALQPGSTPHLSPRQFEMDRQWKVV